MGPKNTPSKESNQPFTELVDVTPGHFLHLRLSPASPPVIQPEAPRITMLATSTARGYDANKSTFYPVVIIGAGMGGIGMACNLKLQFGFDQFRIFERQSGIGGTWWINRYPGIACDM